MKRLVKVNEHGRRIGEDHHRAKLTDNEIDLFFELREEGYGYKRLAKKFEISQSYARDLCKGKRRAQIVCGTKAIEQGCA